MLKSYGSSGIACPARSTDHKFPSKRDDEVLIILPASVPKIARGTR